VIVGTLENLEEERSGSGCVRANGTSGKGKLGSLPRKNCGKSVRFDLKGVLLIPLWDGAFCCNSRREGWGVLPYFKQKLGAGVSAKNGQVRSTARVDGCTIRE